MGTVLFLIGCLFLLLVLQVWAERYIKTQAVVSSTCVIWCMRGFSCSLILRFLPWFSYYPQSLRKLLLALSSLAFLFYVCFFLYRFLVWGYAKVYSSGCGHQVQRKANKRRNIPACFLIPLLSATVILGIGSVQAMTLQVREETVTLAIRCV